jgi:hypothetical protein
MNQQPFTAARAEQHRAQLMDAARHVLDYRRAQDARSLRLQPKRGPHTTARPVPADAI